MSLRCPPCLLVFTLALASVAGPSARAQQTLLAPTPPMGWNSWDSYGPAIREDEVKANTDAMAAKLKSSGWQYLVVDIEWYQPDAHAHGYIARGKVTMDEFGRFVPSPNRFPSAASGKGFKSPCRLCAQQGAEVWQSTSCAASPGRQSIETSRLRAPAFMPRMWPTRSNVCRWAGMEDTYGVDMSKPGGQAYYDSIARLYASWGVDYVKADDMSRPFRGPEIHALRLATHQDRPANRAQPVAWAGAGGQV